MYLSLCLQHGSCLFANTHILKDFQTLYLKARKKTLLTEQGSIHITHCWYRVLAPKSLKEGKHVPQEYISSALSLWFSKPCIFQSTATGCHVFVFLRHLVIPFSQLNQSDLRVRGQCLMDSEVTQQWLYSSPRTFVLDSTRIHGENEITDSPLPLPTSHL